MRSSSLLSLACCFLAVTACYARGKGYKLLQHAVKYLMAESGLVVYAPATGARAVSTVKQATRVLLRMRGTAASRCRCVSP